MKDNIVEQVVVRPTKQAGAVPATRSARLAVVAGWWAENQAILVQAFVIFMTMRVLLSVLAVFFVAFVPEQTGQHYTAHFSSNVWLDVWARWDTEHYIDLAKYGYQLRPELTIFYPLLPGLMALFAPIFNGSVLAAGLFITSVACYIAYVYMYKLAQLEFGDEIAGRSLLYLAAYPTAFFMYAVYTESLFLTLSIGAFYHARRRQWAITAVLVTLAAFSRPNGAVLTAPLAYEAFMQWRADHPTFNFRRIFVFVREFGWAKWLTIVAVPVATVAYALFLWYITNDPLNIFTSRSRPPFGRYIAAPWTIIDLALQHLARVDLPSWDRAISSMEFGFTVFLILITIISWWSLPRIYSLYAIVSTLLILSSTLNNYPTQSMPRYTLSIFPIFFLLARLGANRNWNNAILFGSLLLQGILAVLFCNWYWVF